MELRAFAICQTCGELYPSARLCPGCDGDSVAAVELEMAMSGHALDPATLAPAPAEPDAAWKPLVAVVSIGLVLFTILAVAIQA